MVLPPGHYLDVASRRQFSRREKWIMGTVAIGVAIFALAIAISLIGPSRSRPAGCVEVTILGATGAATLDQCGAQARALCREAGSPGGYTGETAREISAACRKVGLPVG
jgi:hypothetical protein